MDLYIKNLKKRYQQSTRQEKAILLDEFCETSGFHRKHAIRLLNMKNKSQRKCPETRGRKPIYNHKAIIKPLKEIWLATDQLCSKRLKVALPLWVDSYAEFCGGLDDESKSQLLSISATTIERLLTEDRAKTPRRICATKPGSLLKNQIPVKTNQWNESKVGFVEADTVAHCGTSLSGDFVWSVTLTDILTGWTENRATWNKGAEGVVNQITDIENKLPFDIKGFDCDNGSEFLNYHLIRHFQERSAPTQFTRSRPYHKNDNAHVEQKNWTHVRQLFGYYRIENQELVELMNDVYSNECSLLRNYFYPTMKLIEKQRIQSKTKKVHDKPKTPYQRLMDSDCISTEKKQELTEIYKTLNPFKLKKSLEKKLNRIFQKIDLHLNGRKVAI